MYSASVRRQAGEAHGEGEERGAHEDEGDHRRGAHGAHEAGPEALEREGPLDERQRQGADDAQRRRLGRRGDAGIDRAQHRHDQQQDGQKKAALAQALGQGPVPLLREEAGLEEAARDEVAHEQEGQDDARERRRP